MEIRPRVGRRIEAVRPLDSSVVSLDFMLKDHDSFIDFHWILPVVETTCRIDIQLWQSCNPNFRSRRCKTHHTLACLVRTIHFGKVSPTLRSRFISWLHQEDCLNYEEVECVSFSAENVFVGQCPTHGSLHEGNSMLLHLEGLQYAFIGDLVFSFTAKSTITKFVSLVGNSDVPYPWAMDDLRLINLVAQYFSEVSLFNKQSSNKESCDDQGRWISIFIHRGCGSGEQAFWCGRYRPLWSVLQNTRPIYEGWVLRGIATVRARSNSLGTVVCGAFVSILQSIFDRFASFWPCFHTIGLDLLTACRNYLIT